MQTASFNGFIKMVLEIILFYYIIKFLAKLFLPVVIKKVVNKAEQAFQEQYQSKQNPQPKDEVIFDASKAKNPRETKKIGDYVDFEEID